jgi:hypothetical protein
MINDEPNFEFENPFFSSIIPLVVLALSPVDSAMDPLEPPIEDPLEMTTSPDRSFCDDCDTVENTELLLPTASNEPP